MRTKRNGTLSASEADMVEKAKREKAAAKLLREAAKEKSVALQEMEDADAREGLMSEPELESDPAPIPERDLTRLERALAEVGTEGSFEVFHIVGGAESKLGQFDISDWPQRMEILARAKGGGDFKIVFRHANGHYAATTTRTFDVEIYGNKTRQTDDGKTSDMFLRFMEIMSQRDAEHRREVEASRLENQKMLLAMIDKVASNGSIIKSAEDLATLQKMMAPQSPTAALKDILEALSLFREEAGDALAPVSPIQTAINKVLEIARPLIEVGVARLANQMPAATAAPGSAVASLPAPVAGNPPAPVQPEVVPNSPAQSPAPASAVPDTVKQYAAMLKNAIVQGMDPPATAHFVVESVEDKDLPALRQMSSDPGITGLLLQADPELVPSQGWLASFFAAIREAVAFEEAEIANVETSVTEPSGTV